MANPQRQGKPDIEKSEQTVLNQSFDREYNVLGVELLAENETGTALNRLKTDASGNLAIAGTITASSSTLAEFQFNDLDDTTTADTEYYGFTEPDGSWLVKRLVSGSTMGYATVNNNGAVTTYASAWAAIASLTYGRMDEAF